MTKKLVDDVQSKFIEMRAQGVSYKDISKTIEVPVSQLITWSKEFQIDLANARTIALEHAVSQVSQKIGERIELLLAIQQKALNTILDCEFAEVAPEKLWAIAEGVEKQMTRLSESLRFVREGQATDWIVDEDTKSWKP